MLVMEHQTQDNEPQNFATLKNRVDENNRVHSQLFGLLAMLSLDICFWKRHFIWFYFLLSTQKNSNIFVLTNLPAGVLFLFVSHLWPMGLNVLDYHSHLLQRFHPTCGHEGCSHLSPVLVLRVFTAMQIQHSYKQPIMPIEDR